MEKAQWALLAVTAGFICVLLGIFIGRNTKDSIDLFPSLPQTEVSDEATVSTEATEKGKLNINTATVQELTILPGIGDTLALRIVAYRNAYGPYKSIDDLLLVEDIGQTRLDNIRDYITVGP